MMKAAICSIETSSSSVAEVLGFLWLSVTSVTSGNVLNNCFTEDGG